MKFLLQKPITLTFSLVALSLTGCHNTQDTDNVVSERYVHKYGYALTKAEWQAKDYPGQVITLSRRWIDCNEHLRSRAAPWIDDSYLSPQPNGRILHPLQPRGKSQRDPVRRDGNTH